MSHAMPPWTAAAGAPVPMAGYCQPTPLQETLKYSQVVLAPSPVGSLLLSPGSWYAQGFVCAPQVSPAGMGFDFNTIVPFLPPRCDFFVLGHGIFIWWVSTFSCQWLFSN